MSTVVKDLGPVTAYADAVAAGYTGTKEEWQALMASYASVAEEAQEAKEGAEAAQEAAESARDAAIDAKEGAEDAVDGFGAVVTQATNQVVQTVRAEGTTQVGNVSSEGTTQVNAVQAKGAEVLQSIPADYTELSNEVVQLKEDLTAEETTRANAVSAEATAREAADDAINTTLDTKANVNGYYQEMTVGDAEQLVSTVFVEDSVPYQFRTSGGSADIGDREYDEIVGGSIAWNQLCNGTSVTVTSGHKYLLKKSDAWSIGSSTGSAITGLTIGSDMVCDLTQMFGSTIADYIYSLEQATAGAGVAKLKSWGFLQKDYYEYNTGELMHVGGISAHEMVGFNQWDEEWEVGRIDVDTGQEVVSYEGIRSKNYIPVFPNTQYYFFCGDTTVTDFKTRWYDADKNYLGYTPVARYNSVITTPSNAHYLRFCPQDSYGNTYKNDICINLSDASKNGTYEPYVKHTYALDDSVTLRGIPKTDASGNLYYDGDIWHPDGTIDRRYGIVDLGTLTWDKQDTVPPAGLYNFRTRLTGMKTVENGELANILCEKYTTVSTRVMISANVANKSISGRDALIDGIRVYDSAYTDAESFKTAMSGVYLVYELATPTTETATPFTNPQVCDPNGTEEYTTTSIVPVGHYTKYPANLRSAIERVMEQVPEAPSANGTYTLKATRTSSGVTYAWTAE